MRFQSLDMNLLVALDALLVEQSVSAAAARLNMTQSGMSNALARLREHFGDALLVRVSNHMALTPIGETLRPELHDLLRRVREFIQPHGFDPARTERTLTILMEEYVPMSQVARCEERVHAKAPGISLRLFTSRDDVGDRLANGEADLLIASQRALVPGLPKLPLYQDHFVCILGEHHPFDGDALTLDQYLAFDHVKLFHGLRTRDLLGSIGITRRVRATMPNVSSIVQFVRETTCIATLLSRALEPYTDDYKLRRLSPPFELPKVDVFVQWHQRQTSDPLISWFCSELLEGFSISF
jgi:DNA-binding transcriptional LysR family regulator